MSPRCLGCPSPRVTVGAQRPGCPLPCNVGWGEDPTAAGGSSALHGTPPPLLPAPHGPALTRPRALRLPQLSLEAHARQLLRARPLGCTCAALATWSLPLGDPHGRRDADPKESTQPGSPGNPRAALGHTRVYAAHTCAGRGGQRRKRRDLSGDRAEVDTSREKVGRKRKTGCGKAGRKGRGYAKRVGGEMR